MLTYFPPLRPYAQHEITRPPQHAIYVEECGNPKGIPLLVCHDGPGLGTPSYYRRMFDPDIYRIILFDQRGGGHSKPHNDIQHNTMNDLLADIESIREHFAIAHWLVAGCGFGGLLSLCYAINHQNSVSGILAWNTKLGTRLDNQWCFNAGLNRIFPDHYQHFVELIPEEERTDLLSAYHRRLTGTDDIMRMSAAKSWQAWFHHCGSYRAADALPHGEPHHDGMQTLSAATISAHYAINEYFLEPDFIFTQIKDLRKIPAIFVHGRYNMLAPLDNVWRLYKDWDKADLIIVRDAGHDETEPALVDAIVKAGRSIATQF